MGVNNVILFPRTIEQHLEKGFMKLEQSDYEEALEHFIAVTHYDPSHTEAKLAKALCMLELNRYDEVIHITSSLLHDGNDSYFEILRLHIEALIHTGQWEEAQTFLEAVLEEESVPSSFYSQYELLISSMNEEKKRPTNRQYKLEDDLEYKSNLLQQLQTGNSEQKQHAIELMFHLQDDDLEEALKMFLLEENDPVSKTFALQALRSMEYPNHVKMLKNNREYSIDVTNVPIEPEEWQQHCTFVYHLLIDKLESESPSLTNFAIQLWMEYLYILYPDIPEEKQSRLLAASIHAIIAEMVESSPFENIAELYEVKLNPLKKKINDVKKVLQLRMNSYS